MPAFCFVHFMVTLQDQVEMGFTGKYLPVYLHCGRNSGNILFQLLLLHPSLELLELARINQEKGEEIPSVPAQQGREHVSVD